MYTCKYECEQSPEFSPKSEGCFPLVSFSGNDVK